MFTRHLAYELANRRLLGKRRDCRKPVTHIRVRASSLAASQSMSVATVVVAAGRGSRIGGEIPEAIQSFGRQTCHRSCAREAPDGAARRLRPAGHPPGRSAAVRGRRSASPGGGRQAPAARFRWRDAPGVGPSRSGGPRRQGPRPRAHPRRRPPVRERGALRAGDRRRSRARCGGPRRRSHGHDQGGERSRRGRRHAGSRPASRRPDPAIVPVRCAPRRASSGGRRRVMSGFPTTARSPNGLVCGSRCSRARRPM